MLIHLAFLMAFYLFYLFNFIISYSQWFFTSNTASKPLLLFIIFFKKLGIFPAGSIAEININLHSFSFIYDKYQHYST